MLRASHVFRREPACHHERPWFVSGATALDALSTSPRRSSCRAKFATACCVMLALVWLSVPQTHAGQPPTTTKERGRFGPGVRIDWQHRLVEVDAEVVFRKGPLELFACSPQTREHESILRVHARPMHVFQAMGLIGLTPGSPTTFDEDRKQWQRPSGEALALRVRHPSKDGMSEVPIEQWLRDVKRKRPPDRLNWVFAGSRSLRDGKFGADLDGTVVCVVDFDTAMIALGDLHSADNEDLWLEANTEAIPPIGTRCTLVIQAAPDPVPVVYLTAEGSLRHAGKPISLAGAAKLAAESWTPREGTAVILDVEAGASQADRTKILDMLGRAGIERARVEVRAATSKSPRSQPGSGHGG